MRPAADPESRRIPHLVEIQPTADPGDEIVRQVHPVLPLTLYVKAQAAIGVNVGQTTCALSNLEVRRQHAHLRTQLGPKTHADAITLTHRTRQELADPNRLDLPNPPAQRQFRPHE